MDLHSSAPLMEYYFSSERQMRRKVVGVPNRGKVRWKHQICITIKTNLATSLQHISV